jgi:simple sugar transport system permease protein
MNEVYVVLLGTMLLSAPLILAAMGGLASERSGVINIGLEGKMLIACVITSLVSQRTGNAYAGVSAGISASILMSLLHFLLTQTYRIDHIVSGMSINALGFGLSNFVYQRYIASESSARFPHLAENVYLAVAFLAPLMAWIFLEKTRGGLHIMAVGEDPIKSRQMGLSPFAIRFKALVVTGVCCGIAGALIVSSAGVFTNDMTAGRGFIALAALILGGWRPVPALLACLVFGFFDALQIQLQGTEFAGAKMPPEFWKALPYLATLGAMAGLLGKNRAPSGLGKV